MQPQASTEERAKAESFGRQHLTGLVTLLFTDIVDSTMLCQRREALAERSPCGLGPSFYGRES